MTQLQAPAYSREAWESVSRAIPEQPGSQYPILATLQAEHRYMAALLKQLDAQLTALEQKAPVDAHILYEVMHYMTHFPDAFHHPREDMLYQRAGELDASIVENVETLQRDHDYLAKVGNQTLDAIKRWRRGTARAQDVLKPGRDYMASLYRHMSAEEKLVFPQIEQLLGAEDWRELEQEELLAPVADPVFGPWVAREYRNIARKARRSLRRGVDDVTVMEWAGLETVLEAVEVLSKAVDTGNATIRQRLSEVRESSREIVAAGREKGGQPLLVPVRCLAAGTGQYFRFLKDCGAIVGDTANDLGELKRGMRERLRMSRGRGSEATERSEAEGE
jgi:hemerythrin-like domain-containing protein